MALPIEFYVYVGYGLFAMVAVTLVLNFMMGGLLRPFLEVKRSRGKKVLIRMRNNVQDYFVAGSVNEGILTFTDKEDNKRRLAMKKGVVSRAATVYWIEVDDETNTFFLRDTGESVSSYDPVKIDSYITRALVRPGLFGDETIKYVLLLLIVVLVAVGVVAFLTYKNGVAIEAALGALPTGQVIA